jgi:hypothetical protein
MVGLEDEADTNSTAAPSAASSTVEIKRKWSESEIISKLQSGDLMVL